MAGKQFPLSIIIRAVDKATAPMRSIQRTVANIGARWRAFSDQSGLTATIAATQRLGGAMGQLRDRALGVATAVGGIGAIGIGLGSVLVGSMVKTASDFERFAAALVTIQGSSEKARESMAWISDFATKTPYEVDELTQAFIKLKARGFDPTDGMLRSLGDTASGLQLPGGIMQAVEAISDAVMGDNMRLKEAFNIDTSRKGGKITYMYEDLRSGSRKTVSVLETDAKRIRSTLQNILDRNFGGSMARLSKTWSGGLSNLSDQWTRFKLLVMQGGAFDWLTSKLSNLLEKIDQMAASGELKKLADMVGKKLTSALEKAWEMGVKLYESWDDIEAAVQPIINLFTILSNTFGTSNVIIGVLAVTMAALFVPALVSAVAAMWAFNVALWANPIGIVLAVILLVVGALAYFALKVEDGKIKLTEFGEMLLWMSNGPMNLINLFIELFGYILGKWVRIIGDVKAAFADLWDGLQSGFQRAVQWVSDFAEKLTSMIPDWAKGLFGGNTSISVSGAPMGAAGAATGARQAGQSAMAGRQGDVRVQVDLNNLPAGSRVRTQERGKPNFELNQGYAGAGAF